MMEQEETNQQEVTTKQTAASSIRDNYPDTLDVADIQRIMGVGRVQAYNLANSGKFHIVKVGSRIKVSKDVFFKWLEGK